MTATGSNGSPGTATDALVRRLESPSAAALVDLLEIFGDLQTVLGCCERLVGDLAEPHPRSEVAVEAAWTTALLCYARCFAPRGTGTALTDADVAATQPEGDLADWHHALLRLREVYADAAANPREHFTVGVVQEADGSAGGVAITSVRRPLANDLTVRQTGAIAFALSEVVDSRIVAKQAEVFEEVRETPAADLDRMDRIDVVTDGSTGTPSA